MARGRRYDSDDFYRHFYERPRTIEVEGGIKAQSKRGTFGESWWAKRWIAVLESFNIGGRLGRGRSYARKGQVLSVDIDKALVKAKVQGSRPAPYAVTIQVKILSSSEWQRVGHELSSQAIFAAKLLAGEMPLEIEATFQAAGVSLFPEKLLDLATHCSCPDSSNPCKHIAAVYYLLGEEFDRDPFLIFKLRGMTREELVSMIGGVGSITEEQTQSAKNTTGLTQEVGNAPAAAESPKPFVEPLLPDLQAFWEGQELPPDFFGEVAPPPVAAPLLKRLGSFPFWRGSERFVEAMERIYLDAGAAGLRAFVGEDQPPRKP